MIFVHHVDLDRLKRLADAFIRHGPSRLAIGLVGTLGAGKTTFAQCLAESAGVDREDVTSPTFTLLSSYEANVNAGPVTLHHLDAYRLADEDEFLELGVEELFDEDQTWVLVEWADRVASVMPEQTVWVELQVDSEDAPLYRRQATLRCDDALMVPLLQQVHDDVMIDGAS